MFQSQNSCRLLWQTMQDTNVHKRSLSCGVLQYYVLTYVKLKVLKLRSRTNSLCFEFKQLSLQAIEANSEDFICFLSRSNSWLIDSVYILFYLKRFLCHVSLQCLQFTSLYQCVPQKIMNESYQRWLEYIQTSVSVHIMAIVI